MEEQKYIAISPQFKVFTKDGKIVVRSREKGEDFVVSPVIGIIISFFTGVHKVFEAKELTKTILGTNIDYINYLNKLNSFFGDFFVLSDNVIPSNCCASISINNYEKLEPIYFDIILSNRLKGPKTIVFNVTNSCKYGCVYCHNSNNMKKGRPKYVSIDSLRRFFLEAKKMGCEKVILTGGDPLQKENINEIIRTIDCNGIRTFLSTKTPLSESVMEELKMAGLKEIQYSVDSFDDVTLCKMRIHNSTEQNLASIRCIKKSGIEYQLKCVITSINIDEISNFLNICVAEGVKKVGFNIYKGADGDYLVPNERKLEELAKLIDKYRKRDLYIDFNLEERRHICGSLMHTLYLNENGDAAVCFKDYNAKDFILGNINSLSLEEIWNGEVAMTFLVPSKDLFAGSECANCKKFQKCIYYGCYYERYSMNGTPFSKSRECI